MKTSLESLNLELATERVLERLRLLVNSHSTGIVFVPFREKIPLFVLVKDERGEDFPSIALRLYLLALCHHQFVEVKEKRERRALHV